MEQVIRVLARKKIKEGGGWGWFFEIKANIMHCFFTTFEEILPQKGGRSLFPALARSLVYECSSGDIQAVSVAFKGLKNIEVTIFFF